jgi:hypothetical protein
MGGGGVAARPEKRGTRWGCGSYTRKRPGEGLEARLTLAVCAGGTRRWPAVPRRDARAAVAG